MIGVNPAIRIQQETFVEHVEQHEEIGSTNDRALHLASEPNLTTPAIVLTEHQTAGRGRGSHSWQSAAGALTFSLIIDRPTQLPLERMPLLSLVAGLAVREAIENVANLARVKVKWPNDLYLDGRKLGGILTEVPSAVQNRAIIGIGINVNNRLDEAPADVRQRAVSMIDVTETGTDRIALLIAILVQFENLLIEFARIGRLPMEFWSPHCLLTGKRIRLQSPNGAINGECCGVAEDGALLVQIDRELRRIYSAEAINFSE